MSAAHSGCETKPRSMGRVVRSGSPSRSSALVEQNEKAVRDLLERDFAIIDFLARAVVRLAAPPVAWSDKEKLAYAENSITRVLDMEIEKALTYAQYLTTLVGDGDAPGEGTVPTRYPQCERLNRLSRSAQSADYAALVPGGRDMYSSMSREQLAQMIGAEDWVGLQMRLRSEDLLRPDTEVRAGRWVARGLHVFHAVEKIKHDCRGKG